MAHFAHITNGIVDSVLAISEETLTANNGFLCPSCGEHRPKSEWVQTSKNTRGGEYLRGATKAEREANKLIGSDSDIDARNRANYAKIGMAHDSVNDIFVEATAPASWTLDTTKGLHVPPKPMPDAKAGVVYDWDEVKQDWLEITLK